MKNIFCIITSCLIIISITNFCYPQWESDVKLTNDTAVSSVYREISIAVNGNILHVVWYDGRDGNNEIYYKRSTNAGGTWDFDSRLTNNSSNSFNPSIALSGSYLHVVWIDERDGNNEIYYKRSTDGGINWGNDVRLTNDAGSSYNPSIAVSGIDINIVWYDNRDGNYEIYYKHSTDGGTNWGSDIRLTNNSASSNSPIIAKIEQILHVVWYDNRDGNDEIYYKRSTDGGTNWGSDTRLTNQSSASRLPFVAGNGSIVFVFWGDGRDGNDEIYYKRSTDGGLNWGSDIRLTNATRNQWFPSVAVSNLAVHVVWQDERDVQFKYEIYYNRSTDWGTNWETDTRLTNASVLSQFPSVAFSNYCVHVVWQDKRTGNFEIFYKRNPTGNPTRIEKIKAEVPNKFNLKQNFPNPYNPTTKIQFDVAKYENVKIKVFDISGKEIEMIVNERMQPGTYEVEWNGEKYASGIYFYRMEVGNNVETRKMILIR